MGGGEQKAERDATQLRGIGTGIVEILEVKAASAGASLFGNLVDWVSAALSDPGADGTLDGLDCRGVPHDVFDFFTVKSVKPK